MPDFYEYRLNMHSKKEIKRKKTIEVH